MGNHSDQDNQASKLRIDPRSYHSPFGQEVAPSELRADEPGFARMIGTIALCALFVGSAVVYMNRVSPRWVPESIGFLMVMLGVAGLLFHAARDPDRQVRRTYGFLGGFLPLGIAAATVLPIGGQFGAYFLPLGAPALLIALVFLLPFARHETDPFWQRVILLTLAVIGFLLALAGFIGGNASSRFLLPHGLVLALLGLFYLWVVIGLLSGKNLGYRLAQAAGALGGIALVVAIVRSLVQHRYFVPDGLLLAALGALFLLLAIGICSERQIVVLTRRELSAYFYSPIAYLVLFGMTVVSWLNYWLFVGGLLQASTETAIPEPILRDYIVALIPVIGVIFVIPVLTMRLLSEEKRTGTLEVLLTAPLDEPTVVLSKFFAALAYYLVLCLPMGLFLIALRVEGGKPFDILPLISFFVALASSGAAFVAMGLFFSSLTRNQIIAAVLTFMGMMFLLGFYLLIRMRIPGPDFSAVLKQLSFIHLWLDSLGGKLYLRDVVGQLSMAVFFLFLTVKVLEARKWS